MSTISVPMTPELEEFIESEIKEGKAETKTDVVRRALRLLQAHEAMQGLLQAEQEMKEGKILRGDLRELVKKIK